MIVFLDIDGVTIPNSMFYFDPAASRNRTMSNTSIGLLNWICKKSGAKIVTNTTHNNYISLENENLRQALIRNGLEENNLHSEWHTTYNISCDSRMKAIEYWLIKNHLENIRWVCFDDTQFTKQHNLILTDPDDGLLLHHAVTALAKFGIHHKILTF